MSSGKVHDQTTWMGAAMFGTTMLVVTNNPIHSGYLCAGVLFGGLMFSPDLDIKSKPWRRWGLLRFIWSPYQKWIPHRSWLSHSPIIGTLVKLLYLGIPIAIALYSFGEIEITPQILKLLFQQFIDSGLWLFLVGVELGCCIHLGMDWLSSNN